MKNIALKLKELDLFNDFNQEDLVAMLENFNFSIVHYRKGEVIKQMDDDYQDLIILLSGKICSEMQDINGKSIKVGTMEAPEIIASGVLFSNKYNLPVDIIAIEDSSILSIPKKSVLMLCQENQKFLTSLLQDMGNRICFLANRMYSLTMKTIKEKIALFLIEKSNGNSSFILDMTKEEIARLFGVARPSLSRAFQEMIQSDLINQEGKTIIIKDLQTLKQLAGYK
ncbi:MAG: Crp/Fnr family transcriptional regulator [Kosmotogaceae bacterium]